MKRYIVFVTFYFIFSQCYSSENSNHDQKSQPIETVYPKCFHADNPSDIFVHKEYFDPIYGYAITPFTNKKINRNHFRPRPFYSNIRTIIIHNTITNFTKTIEEFTNITTRRKISSHYVIAKPTEAEPDKQLLQAVAENRIAFHVGRSSWGGHWHLNSISLGIEIVNSGNTSGSWEPFFQEQIHIAGLLAARVAKQYNVLPHYIVGHSDVSAAQAIDPGVMFPWGQLYKDYGVGAWLDDDEMDEKVINAKYRPSEPCPQKPNQKVFVDYLNKYGYCVFSKTRAIQAFKAHFSANQKPEMCNADITQLDMYWVWALMAKYSPKHQGRL